MNAVRYVFLSICLIAEIGLLVFGIAGIAAFWGDSNASVPIAMVIAMTVCAAVQIGVTVAGFIKVRRKREFPVLPGFFLKLGAFMIALGVSWFALEIPEAGWVGLILGGLLAALGLLWPRLAGSGPKIESRHAVSRPVFRADKAEWAWEDAAIEYLRLHGQNIERGTEECSRILREIAEQVPGTLSDTAGDHAGMPAARTSSDQASLSDTIFDYAGMPIAYFLGWLIGRDLVSDAFKELQDPGDLRAVKGGSLSPLEILRNMDYVLETNDVAPEARPFVDWYYNTEKGPAPFSHRTQRYFLDYYRVICSGYDVPRYYCVDWDKDKAAELAQVLDRRYKEFSESGWDEDELKTGGEKLRAPYFDTEAELVWETGTLRRYVRLCADAYQNMGEHLAKELSENLIEYCQDEGEMTTEMVLSKFEPSRVVVLKPRDEDAAEIGEVPAFVIQGGCEWEPEHGVSFTVIGEYVVGSEYYADAESPWEEDLLWKYRIRRDAENGRTCTAEVIPVTFGGRASADNQVVIPAAAQERRREYDARIEALFMLGLAERYDCRLTYDGDVPNYMFIAASKGDERTYADSLPLK